MLLSLYPLTTIRCPDADAFCSQVQACRTERYEGTRYWYSERSCDYPAGSLCVHFLRSFFVSLADADTQLVAVVVAALSELTPVVGEETRSTTFARLSSYDCCENAGLLPSCTIKCISAVHLHL